MPLVIPETFHVSTFSVILEVLCVTSIGLIIFLSRILSKVDKSQAHDKGSSPSTLPLCNDEKKHASHDDKRLSLNSSCSRSSTSTSFRVASSSSSNSTNTPEKRLQIQFLACYLLGTAADWVQGPYVFALYSSYGYTKEQNAVLFVAGFGSSLLSGTFVGLFADRTGRKNACLLYCALYVLSSSLKHVRKYEVLLLGRIFGGMATSLLFSVFDAWMVSEHEKRNFSIDLVSNTFSKAVYYNGITAVLCGFVGQVVASIGPLTPLGGEFYAGGYTAPFDLSILFSVLCGLAIFFLWTENYGERKENESLLSTLGAAARLVAKTRRILVVGLAASMFEASMYIFVFNWTPALTVEGEPQPPYGFIFSTFMLSVMLGSTIFSFLNQVVGYSAKTIAVITVFLATISHSIVLTQGSTYVNLIAFMVFELSVGMYFPSMGTLKAEVVPDSHRSTVYNLFRIPLNLIVVWTLCAKSTLTEAFAVTTMLLLLSFLLLHFEMSNTRLGDKEGKQNVTI